MKKVLIGLLIVLGVLLLAGVGLGTYGYFKYYKPMFSGFTAVGGSQRLEASLVKNKAPFDPPASGELTDDQIARFLTVEADVRERIGQRMEFFTAQYARLKTDVGAPTSAQVRASMGELSGPYLQAKETQCRALNSVGFSMAEYRWVREQVYSGAGLPYAQLELAELLEDPANAQRAIPITVAHGAPIDRNRQLVAPHADKLKDLLVLAFFDL